MKYPIVHTNFLRELVLDVNISAFNCSEVVNANFTIESLVDKDRFESAWDIIESNRARLLDDIIEMQKTGDADPSDYADITSELEHEDRIAIDLILLEELGGVSYATPSKIGDSIKWLSNALAHELAKKLNDEPMFNSYYYGKLAEVLSELCTIIKEV